MTLDVAWYESPVQSPTGEQFSYTWEELCELLKSRTYSGSKLRAPGWAPHLCEGPRRNEHVRHLSCLVLDVDHRSDADAGAVLAAVEGFACAVHTTASHAEGSNCLRVVLPLARPVPVDRWRSAWIAFVEGHGLAGKVDALKDPARFYFVPTAAFGGSGEFEIQEGALLDLFPLADAPAPQPPSAPAPPSPPEAVDLSEVRAALRSWGSGDAEKDRRARAVYDGDPWAERGGRDSGLAALVGQLVGRWPDMTAEVLRFLLHPSAAALAARDAGSGDEGEDTAEHWLSKAEALAERFRPQALEHRDERRAREEATRAAQDAFAARVRARKGGAVAPAAPSPSDVAPEACAEWERPTILVGDDLERMVVEAEEALAADPRVFCAAGQLSRLVVGGGRPLAFAREGDDVPQIVPIDRDVLWVFLSSAARWEAVDAKGVARSVRPPKDVAAALLNYRPWPSVSKLTGFVETPCVRPDGTLVTAAGYDEQTGVYYVKGCDFGEVPEEPTGEQVAEATRVILDAVVDFPFASEASKSAWVAALLTPFVRHCLDGLVPMFVVDANTPGTGKTLLVDLISVVCTGRLIPKMANTSDDDEMRKRLLAIALSGKSQVTFDNVRDSLGTPSLDGAITAGFVEDRLLGVNRVVSAPLRVTWFATGNNVAYEGDLARRVLPITLRSDLERPEERRGFQHPDLYRWALENRGRLVSACLTVLRAYHAAGCPKPAERQQWGSFERWQAAVSDCVRWIGLEAPESARAALRGSGVAEQEQAVYVTRMLEELCGGEYLSTAQVLAALQDPTKRGRWAEGRGALQDLCRGHGSEVTMRHLGRLLHRWRDRIFGGKKIVCRVRDGRTLWAVAGETIVAEGNLK